jgi:hypothetical protein
MTVELKQVHRQRLQLAVDAARAGGRIHFRVTSAEPRTIVWVNERVPGVPHTILNLWGRSDVWMNEVERVYQEMLYEARK